MKLPFLPRPSREELLTRSVQVIVRDYPETLGSLREFGMSPGEFGDRSLEELEDDVAALLDELELATAWRPGTATA